MIGARSTSGRHLSTKWEIAVSAPVLPALTIPCKAIVNEIGRDAHRRLFFAPDRLARRISHRDDLARFDEFESITNASRSGGGIEQGRNHARLPDEFQT